MQNRKEYFKLMQEYPEAFENHPDDICGIRVVTQPELIDDIEVKTRRRLADKNLPEDWAEVGVVYRDQYLTLLRDAVYFHPGNKPGTYIRFFNPNEISGVAILPVYRESICLIKIFRHALRRYVLEIPRGFSEAGYTPLQNAEKELREEIGGKARNIYDLGYVRENSGMGNAKAALFYADLEDVSVEGEHEEGIQKVIFVSKKEFAEMIKKGTLEDSFTLGAVLRATLMGYLTL